MKKRFRRLKHYLIPHKGNKFKPAIFAKESVAVIVLVLFVIEGVYVFGTPLLLQKTGFTAAVLPAALTDMTNSDRVASGDQALTTDPLLQKAAQAKADDMAAKGYFAHVSPEGKTPWYWLDSVGYKYTYAGENLAIDFTDSSDVETAWMNSPEHHANIVKPQYTQIGIATAQGMYNGQETTFVVEDFATLPQKAAAPAPVAAAPEKSVASAAAAAPTPAPVEKPEVLGAQTAPVPKAAGAFAGAITSPNRTLTWALGIFAALIAILLGVAIFVKVRVQYVEVIAGGALLIIVALGFMILNDNAVSAVQLPLSNQSASVSLAL